MAVIFFSRCYLNVSLVLLCIPALPIDGNPACELWQVSNVFLQMYTWYTWAASRFQPARRSSPNASFLAQSARASSVGRTISIRTWSSNAGSCRDSAVPTANTPPRNHPTYALMYVGYTAATRSTWSTFRSSNATTEDIEKYSLLSVKSQGSSKCIVF